MMFLLFRLVANLILLPLDFLFIKVHCSPDLFLDYLEQSMTTDLTIALRYPFLCQNPSTLNLVFYSFITITTTNKKLYYKMLGILFFGFDISLLEIILSSFAIYQEKLNLPPFPFS